MADTGGPVAGHSQELPKTPRFRTPATAIGALFFLWLVYAMNANTRQIFYYVLPSIVKEFELTPAGAGIISTIVTVATALVAIPAGPWFDKGGHGWARKYRNAIVAAGYFCSPS